MFQEERVSFSGLIPFAGLVGGVAIAVGLPYVILKYGAGTPDVPGLSMAAQTGIIIMALIFGSAVTFCSAFFGIVIPRRVYESPRRNRDGRSCRDNLDTGQSG